MFLIIVDKMGKKVNSSLHSELRFQDLEDFLDFPLSLSIGLEWEICSSVVRSSSLSSDRGEILLNIIFLLNYALIQSSFDMQIEEWRSFICWTSEIVGSCVVTQEFFIGKISIIICSQDHKEHLLKWFVWAALDWSRIWV